MLPDLPFPRGAAARPEGETVPAPADREKAGGTGDALPRAVLVYDAFHVIQLFNHNLSQRRREFYSPSKGKAERWMQKGVQWLLLKNPEN